MLRKVRNEDILWCGKFSASIMESILTCQMTDALDVAVYCIMTKHKLVLEFGGFVNRHESSNIKDRPNPRSLQSGSIYSQAATFALTSRYSC